MPADRTLAAFGCGFGAVILGASVPRVLSLATSRTVPVSVRLTPWWFSALFVVMAVAVAVRVTGWMLRMALVVFAVNRLFSIPFVASALSINLLTQTTVNGLFACLLLGASWPHASGRAKIAAVVLFVFFSAFALWVSGGRASVIAWRP